MLRTPMRMFKVCMRIASRGRFSIVCLGEVLNIHSLDNRCSVNKTFNRS
jgi:hypothetical protein